MTVKVSGTARWLQRRDNDAVPATVRPDLPPLVEDAVDALGNRVRVAVIQSLTTDGPTTRAELARRLDLSASLLQGHLRRLEELGVAYVSPPRSEPGRLQRRYHVDAIRVEKLGVALLGAVTRTDG